MQNITTNVQIKLAHELIDSFFTWKYAHPFTNKDIRDARTIEHILNGGYGTSTPYFPTVQDKAIKLMDILLLGCPFWEANPRVAYVALKTILEKNGMALTADQEELKTFFHRTLTSNKIPRGSTDWLKEKTKSSTISIAEDLASMRAIIVESNEMLTFLAEKEYKDLPSILH